MSGLVWLLVCGCCPFLGDAHKPVRGAVKSFREPWNLPNFYSEWISNQTPASPWIGERKGNTRWQRYHLIDPLHPSRANERALCVAFWAYFSIARLSVISHQIYRWDPEWGERRDEWTFYVMLRTQKHKTRFSQPPMRYRILSWNLCISLKRRLKVSLLSFLSLPHSAVL